jgi:hypothetical protein
VFCSGFASCGAFKGLFSLNLEGTKDLPLGLLFCSITELGMLSLGNCGIEISSVLARLATFPNLSILCLSGNRCDGPIPDLPVRLHSLSANRVSWSETTLADFLIKCSRLPLKLSVSAAVLLEWKRVFTAIGFCERGYLQSLDWGHNRVHPALFNFLNRNHELESVSLSGCFKSTDDNKISWLISYLSCKFTRLKWFELRGSDSFFLGDAIARVLQPLLRMPSLEFLDVFGNAGGEATLEALRPFLRPDAPVKRLVMGGVGLSTPGPLVALLRDVAAAKKLQLSFPQSDLMEFAKHGKLTYEQVGELRSLFLLPPRDSGFFGAPYEVYRYAKERLFPAFVTRQQTQEILRGRRQAPPQGGLRPPLIPSPNPSQSARLSSSLQASEGAPSTDLSSS